MSLREAVLFSLLSSTWVEPVLHLERELMDDGWNTSVASTQDKEPEKASCNDAASGCKVAPSKNNFLISSLHLHTWRRVQLFSRCFSCDGNLEWTRPFLSPLLAQWKSSSLPRSLRVAKAALACAVLFFPRVVVLALFFSSQFSAPGNHIWARA